MATVAELAWAAGLIDGEGCISIQRTEAEVFGKKTVSPRHRLILKVTMCDLRPIKKLVEIFGVGSTSVRAGGDRTSTAHTWLCNRRDTMYVLGLLRPYFVLKGEEADVAVEFCNLTFHAMGRVAVSPKELKKRERLFLKMRSLKSRSKFLRMGEKPGRKRRK